jgi:hypothetical protein
LLRRESFPGEVAERFGMKESLATPQQVPMERFVHGQVRYGQGCADVLGVRLEESHDVWAYELLLVDVRNFNWRPRPQPSWKSSGVPARMPMLLYEVQRRHVADDTEIKALDEILELTGQRHLLR